MTNLRKFKLSYTNYVEVRDILVRFASRIASVAAAMLCALPLVCCYESTTTLHEFCENPDVIKGCAPFNQAVVSGRNYEISHCTDSKQRTYTLAQSSLVAAALPQTCFYEGHITTASSTAPAIAARTCSDIEIYCGKTDFCSQTPFYPKSLECLPAAGFRGADGGLSDDARVSD